MLVVPCIKLAEQAQISAAAKNAECKGPVRPCTGSGSGDVCSKTRELVACFQTCWCQTKIGKDAMKNFRELLDQSGAQCPLTCGPGAWLPGTSAAILILFGLFNMVFELPTALFVCSNAGCMSCCKDWIQGMRTVLSRVSPKWARSIVCIFEATILIVLQLHHEWSVTGWAFSVMCCFIGILYAVAICAPASEGSESTSEPRSSDREMQGRRRRKLDLGGMEEKGDEEIGGEGGDGGEGRGGAFSPVAEETPSTFAAGRARPPQIQEDMDKGFITVDI